MHTPLLWLPCRILNPLKGHLSKGHLTMGTIQTEYDRPRNLTFVRATGQLTPNDIQEWTKAYYGGTVTKLMVWDIIEADLSDLQVGDVVDSVEYAAHVDVGPRKGRKTAIVAGENLLGLALSKVGEVFVDKSSLPIEMRTFTTMDEAMEWLGMNRDSGPPTNLPEAS